MSGGALPTLDPAASGDAGGRVHRRLFLAGIAVALTLGAGWGAWLLLQIATVGSFTAPSVFAVNAAEHNGVDLDALRKELAAHVS